MTNITFRVNAHKALEAIVYIANKMPNLDHYHIVKTIFYADKKHLNSYARPIIGDRYVKMPYGPVPSLVLNIINLSPEYLTHEIFEKTKNSLNLISSTNGKMVSATREADLDAFSDSDLECLDEAFEFCKDKEFDELKELTHSEESWKKAADNCSMDYSLMIDKDNPNREEIIADIKESAEFMVL